MAYSAQSTRRRNESTTPPLEPSVQKRDSNLTSSHKKLWPQLKRHFTESFAGELLSQRREHDGERLDEVRMKRRRNAYRYVLLLLAVILLPIVAHNIYIRQLFPAAGALLLLGILMVNILLLSINREAFLAPPLVLALSTALVMLSLYYGQNYNLYLLFPLLVALPVLLKTRWAVFLGVLVGLLVAPAVLTQYDRITGAAIGSSMGLTWLVSAWLVFVMTEQSRRLRGMAITDSLTGAFNRRYLEYQAVSCMQEWDRYQRPASLLLLDIDHFKHINDQFGHAVGDAALQSLVGLIQNRIRKVDILCRFGGEEFVVLLRETTIENARHLAEALRQIVEAATILPEGSMTVSVGVCDVTQAQDMGHWFKLADNALYQAKRNGRNRVELSAPESAVAVPLAKTLPEWR
ncbi:MAG TPA: GGDEF domain-containing protein [Halioglobus sp.]